MNHENVKMNFSQPVEDSSMLSINDGLNEALFNTMRLAACRNDILAAYKAREKCYKLCRRYASVPDYKEYVEVFQLDNFPDELKKADYGKRYVKRSYWLAFCSVVCAVAVMAVICLSYFVTWPDPLLLYSCLTIAVVSCVLIVYLAKKMKALSMSIRELIK